MAKTRILIVDDNKHKRALIRRALEGQPDWEISEAVDGLVAVTLIDSLQPDIILGDMIMPRLDGVTMFRALMGRSHPATRVLMVEESLGYGDMMDGYVNNGTIHHYLLESVGQPRLGEMVKLVMEVVEKRRTEKKDEPVHQAGQEEREISTSEKALRVVVVDDDPSVCSALKRLLRGCEVETFTHPADALAHFAAGNEVDLILSDYRMPGLTGTQLFSAVKRLSPRTMRVIMSAGDVPDAKKALESGVAKYFMGKPFEREELKKIVHEARQLIEADLPPS